MAVAERRTKAPRAAARLFFGPTDHLCEVDEDVLAKADYEPGFRYEIIDGRLHVSPSPNAPHQRVLLWLQDQLNEYKQTHPDRIKKATTGARVYVPRRLKTTVPEPDLAVYDVFPKSSIWKTDWRLLFPIVVVEVTDINLGKDFVRNVKLYEEVPSIREYWVIHYGSDPDTFFFRAYVKRAGRWGKKPRDLRFGDTYATTLFPGFTLKLEPE